MKCPHCRVHFHDSPTHLKIGIDEDGGWYLVRRTCPACNRLILHLQYGEPVTDQHLNLVNIKKTKTILVRPKGSIRPPCPVEVPEKLAEDYNEACIVLSDSPKASAALSRRCLQLLLREVVKVKPSNLSDEIQQVMDSGNLPSHLAEVVDAIRNIGNFAAHPLKSEKSGEIFPVKQAEAEWNLDVLEALFDFYFVQPTATKKKRAVLDQKLKQAGMRPMK